MPGRKDWDGISSLPFFCRFPCLVNSNSRNALSVLLFLYLWVPASAEHLNLMKRLVGCQNNERGRDESRV